ncbi:DUF4349 domain-containing protein [Thermoproteota archaeon]
MKNYHVIEKLSLYIDNALSQQEKTLVDQHLKECSECRHELELLKQTTSVVSQWQAPSPDPDFERQVRENIFNWEMEKEAVKMKPKWRLIGVPATAVVGIIIVLFAGTLMRTTMNARIRESADYLGDEIDEKHAYISRKSKPALTLQESLKSFTSVQYEPYYFSDDMSEAGRDSGGIFRSQPVGTWASRTDYADRSGWEKSGALSRSSRISSDELGVAYDGVTDQEQLLAQTRIRPVFRRNMTTEESEADLDYTTMGISPIIVVQPVLPAAGEGERVIRTAQVRLEVEDGQKAYTEISKLCQDFGGFLAQSSFYKSEDGVQSGVVTLRIPKAKFTEALDEIKKIGKVDSINTQSQDVSRQYADLESRLKTSMIVYEKMMKALEGRKVTIPEAMRLESELTPVTSRIEMIKAQIEKLNNLTSFTTINVQFHESKVAASVIKENIRRAKENIVVYLLGALHFLVAALPTLLALVILGAIGLTILLVIKHKIVRFINRNKK